MDSQQDESNLQNQSTVRDSCTQSDVLQMRPDQSANQPSGPPATAPDEWQTEQENTPPMNTTNCCMMASTPKTGTKPKQFNLINRDDASYSRMIASLDCTNIPVNESALPPNITLSYNNTEEEPLLTLPAHWQYENPQWTESDSCTYCNPGSRRSTLQSSTWCASESTFDTNVFSRALIINNALDDQSDDEELLVQQSWFNYPPDTHSILLRNLFAKYVTFRVFLGGFSFDINPTQRGGLFKEKHFNEILSLAKQAFQNASILITPLQLSIQTYTKDTQIFLPMENTAIDGTTPVLGTLCHRFIVPLKITAYKIWSIAHHRHSLAINRQRRLEEDANPNKADNDHRGYQRSQPQQDGRYTNRQDRQFNNQDYDGPRRRLQTQPQRRQFRPEAQHRY
jgi:hypothetical protein